MKTEKKTKGILVEGLATLVKSYTACVGCMAWETPHCVFEIADGRKFVWRSEDEKLLGREHVDHIAGPAQFQLRAFAYDTLVGGLPTLRRVSLTTVNTQVAS